MKVEIYLFQHKHVCAIVSTKEGNKFVGNLEYTYPDWQDLLREARTGFDSYPYYDRYRNNDVDFRDMYLDIREGEDERYSFIGSVHDGIYDFSLEQLDTDCSYFSSLFTVMQFAEAYDFSAEQVEELKQAIIESGDTVELNIRNASVGNRQLAISFARQFDSLDEETSKKLFSILNKHRED